MSQPKIMVFHLKELLYTMMFIALGILLIVLFIVFLLPKFSGYGKDAGTVSDGAEETSSTDVESSAGVSSGTVGSAEETGSDSGISQANASSDATAGTSSDAVYYAGIYTSSYVMNNQTMEIEVVLDENHINSVRFVNVDDAVETVSPLLLPAMESIAEQIVNSQSLDGLTAPEGSEYTYQVLIEAIRTTIAKGEVG
ncbi:MAG: hypothetical protein LUE29_12460 [Lachnospiraceae bacterium]|nr:hypothetical protein [Lachnospiraceae bacterium]